MSGHQFDLLHMATGGTLGAASVVAGCSYGNDSIALIQWLLECDFQEVVCLYNDTGWSWPAHDDQEAWLDRVSRMEEWVRRIGFRAERTASIGMEALVKSSRGSGWPRQGMQFCTDELKIKPTLTWLAENDPRGVALCMNGKRRAESTNRANTPEWIEESPFHGGRCLRQPLFEHSDAQRDALITRAGIAVLAHKSRECACVNSGAADLRAWPEAVIGTVERIERELGAKKTMFRPAKKMGATGIREVIAWANAGPGKYRSLDDGFGPTASETGCDGGFCLS